MSITCLACHSTYFKKTSAAAKAPPTFNRQKMIYGITCERCHGPAAQHVLYFENHPNDTIIPLPDILYSHSY
ncbi:multiheme c-type cytochrome [Hydrotalea sp.]|uniref:multiheme c-type cytochrome n=1 Tax=Hydrotalea sp. TaxID=2881279 RepID=UPI0034459474